MEAYRKQIRRRIPWLVIASVMAVALIILAIGIFGIQLPGTAADDFIRGMQTGLCAVLLVALVGTTISLVRMLGNEKLLEKTFVTETDERNRFIRDKIGGIGMDVSLVILAIATIVSGFYSRTVFFTLAAVLVCQVHVKAGLKLYYRQKF